MTSPATIMNTGDAPVFFDQQFLGTNPDTLIATQVDPSQPQVAGLTSVTAPLVPDRHSVDRLGNFNRELFDLSASSHLTRLLNALLGASGIGGVRRQQAFYRMSASLAGTNFLDLDGFWGSLFALQRLNDEKMPVDDTTGLAVNPLTDVADSPTWDTVTARDGKYRSRIEQLAKGFASGGSPLGMELAASAILNCEVEIIESWAVDPVNSFSGNTWTAVTHQYTTYAAATSKLWSVVAGITPGNAASVNRPLNVQNEIVVVPGRAITENERYQLLTVLDVLRPAGSIITVTDSIFVRESIVKVRDAQADSNDWSVVSVVVPQDDPIEGVDLVYPVGTSVESPRPGMSDYTGERWSYNSRIAQVSSYAMDPDGNMLSEVDYQTVTFVDGSSTDYTPDQAMANSQQLALARASADGVITNFLGSS